MHKLMSFDSQDRHISSWRLLDRSEDRFPQIHPSWTAAALVRLSRTAACVRLSWSLVSALQPPSQRLPFVPRV